MDDHLIETAVHDTLVRRLQHAYADVVNRRAWSELDDLFLPDCQVVIDRRAGEPLTLTGGTELGTFIGGSIAVFEFFEFVVLNAHVGFPDGPSAGTAVGRMFMCEHRQTTDGGRFTTAFGLYHDRYTFDGSSWWFAERRYHSLARHAAQLEVFPLPATPGIDVPGTRG